ncbi:SAM-dependent methyltransferase [Pseudoalteromonas sp. MM17-2]|uniref:N-6 DNA methylase n=1 Tax=Pseudoalteromonas sp. MM17-2 TaxID=2917753 RepID=UPI001EF3F63B|nr:N-6 DNA methylase [Pseudoalteromonas sp. MM17-2]MCG7543532.1 SAM-dependent methyltransferase [Pseudoalteromonas sp. MM17-2]
MIKLEALVRDIVESYNHAGFINDTELERKFFLSFLTICFINRVQNGYYQEQVELLFNIVDSNDLIAVLEVEFHNELHASLYAEVVNTALGLSDLTSLFKMTDKLAFLLEPKALHSFKRYELTVIYDRVLQRLQLMNAEDRLSKSFSYQEPPFDFSELISLLANMDKPHHAYDPFATTGESSVSYVVNNTNVSITTESVLQTSKYIHDKLLIAGAENIDAKHSFALSPVANVKQESFDVAYTLFQPTETEGVREHEIKERYKKEFLDKRVDSNTIFDKYREHGFIQHIIWSLKKDGIGFVVLGKGPLHRQAESNARNLLLDGNFVDAVIQLPPKLITSRTVPLYVLVLRKNRGNNTKIKFIDASSFCEFNGKYNNLNDLKRLADIYHSGTSEPNMFTEVDISNIDRNSAQLSVSRYVSSEKASYEQIDTDIIRQELAKQQKLTDHLLSKL